MTDRYLLDTNILFRLKNKSDPDYPVVTTRIFSLLNAGASLHTCSQNMIEYRVVATRPIDKNGYGLSSDEAAADITAYSATFPLLLDTNTPIDVFPIWRNYVELAGTLGKPNHDARILAFAQAQGCTHLLTFNDKDFTRYADIVPSVTIVNPRKV